MSSVTGRTIAEIEHTRVTETKTRIKFRSGEPRHSSSLYEDRRALPSPGYGSATGSRLSTVRDDYEDSATPYVIPVVERRPKSTASRSVATSTTPALPYHQQLALPALAPRKSISSSQSFASASRSGTGGTFVYAQPLPGRGDNGTVTYEEVGRGSYEDAPYGTKPIRRESIRDASSTTSGFPLARRNSISAGSVHTVDTDFTFTPKRNSITSNSGALVPFQKPRKEKHSSSFLSSITSTPLRKPRNSSSTHTPSVLSQPSVASTATFRPETIRTTGSSRRESRFVRSRHGSISIER